MKRIKIEIEIDGKKYVEEKNNTDLATIIGLLCFLKKAILKNDL